jgi:hypothetical protein
MNGKTLKNWLKSSLLIQQICEIADCQNKVEYCITQFHGRSVRVCPEHFEQSSAVREALK